MKAITTIFESILRENKNLVWAPDDVEATPTGMTSVWSWNPISPVA